MAQSNQIGTKVLVLSGQNTMYFGEYDGRVGDNVRLLNVRAILCCKEPFYKVSSKGATCMLSQKLNSAEIKDVERVVRLSDAVYSKLYSNPVLHTSNVYDFVLASKNSWYNLLHIAKANDQELKSIQGSAVAITLQKGKAGTGFVVGLTLDIHPCYTITFGETIGIGDSLHSAYENAKMLVLGCTTTNYRVHDYAEYVVKRYPDVDKKVPVIELIELHNIITGSCSKGIRSFCMQHSVNLDGTASVRHFLTLTKGAYQPEIIEAIAEKYGITI